MARPGISSDKSMDDLPAGHELLAAPRALPIVRRRPAVPVPPLLCLFDVLPEQRRSEPPPASPTPARYEALQVAEMVTDEGWERLAATIDRTTPECVAGCVGVRVGMGRLSVRNGRSLLEANGVAFGYDRKLGRWRRYPELMSLAAEHAEAISRLDVAAVAVVRAERHRARALRAAETRRRNRAAAGA